LYPIKNYDKISVPTTGIISNKSTEVLTLEKYDKLSGRTDISVIEKL